MILTDLDHLPSQVTMTPAMHAAIEFLRAGKWRGAADGRLEIDGDKVYASMQSAQTETISAAPPVEAHRKYIDVQFLIEGNEVIGWVSADKLTITQPYNVENDIWFGTLPANQLSMLRLIPGQLAVFYPEDGHLPRRTFDKPAMLKKLVVKVAVGA